MLCEKYCRSILRLRLLEAIALAALLVIFAEASVQAQLDPAQSTFLVQDSQRH